MYVCILKEWKQKGVYQIRCLTRHEKEKYVIISTSKKV